jgi:hypothetical protein
MSAFTSSINTYAFRRGQYIKFMSSIIQGLDVLLLLVLLLLLTTIEMSLRGSTDKTYNERNNTKTQYKQYKTQ